MKKKKSIINRNSVILSIFILFIIVMSIFLSSLLSDYSRIGLIINKNEKFNVSDLTIDNLNYMNNEKDVIKKYGEPSKVKEESIDGFKYKIYEYNGLKIYLKEYYDSYNICKVMVTSNKYTISNSIKIGNKIVSAINKFSVQNRKGEYIYGNYSSDSLDDETIKDEIAFGRRTKEFIEYVHRDKVITDSYDIPINVAKLSIYYKKGRINKIIWSYNTK